MFHDDSNTQYVLPSNGEEELDTNNYIAPPKTPEYRPNEDDDETIRRTALRNHNQDQPRARQGYTGKTVC